jgi:hypothetical protein
LSHAISSSGESGGGQEVDLFGQMADNASEEGPMVLPSPIPLPAATPALDGKPPAVSDLAADAVFLSFSDHFAPSPESSEFSAEGSPDAAMLHTAAALMGLLLVGGYSRSADQTETLREERRSLKI